MTVGALHFLLYNECIYTSVFYNVAGPDSMIKLLIDKGANINARNKDKDSVLILAIHSGTSIHSFILKVLHGFGKRSFSMKLFWLGYDKAATLLIQKGVDVNAVGKYGKTALLEAANKGKQKAILNSVMQLFKKCHDNFYHIGRRSSTMYSLTQ